MNDGRRLALELSTGKSPTPKAILEVSRGTDADSSSWAFSQWKLRGRAAAKFERAAEMLFTTEALEQATALMVAEYHASKFPPGALVADLTVGIGADVIALAARGPALGFELDAERAEFATHNLGVYGLRAPIRIEDCLAPSWDFEYAYADPSRRVGGRRTLALEEFSPDPRLIATRMASLKLGVIKLTPMLADSQLEELGPRMEFLSHAGECKEALVCVGYTAEPGRLAVHIESGEQLDGGPAPLCIERTHEFFFEADPAAIRAHALGTLCSAHSLAALGDSNGYLTGGSPVSSCFLKVYKVLYSDHADLRKTNAALRDLSADLPVLKQRGAGLDLEKFRKQFKSYGRRPVLLAVWTIGNSLRHTILERI